MASISEIHPRCIVAGRTTFRPGFDGVGQPDAADILDDHDMQLAIRGCGAVVIDGVEYYLEKGDFLTIFPGETFYVKSYGEIPFTRYFIHMDFFRDEARRTRTPVMSAGEPWPRLVRLSYDLDIRAKCAELVLKRLGTDSGDRLILDGELLSLIGMVMAQYQHSDIELQAGCSKCRRNVLKAARFIVDHYAEHISVDDMAQIAELSTSYFAGMFKAIVGKTPANYLIDYRIEQAKRLMIETEHNVGEIAVLIGYGDIHYFSYLFKRREGITPTEFISRFSHDE